MESDKKPIEANARTIFYVCPSPEDHHSILKRYIHYKKFIVRGEKDKKKEYN